jgi:hypothetical protein
LGGGGGRGGRSSLGSFSLISVVGSVFGVTEGVIGFEVGPVSSRPAISFSRNGILIRAIAGLPPFVKT